MYDYLIIGAGIAGTGLAYSLPDGASVAVMDMEDTAGYHTTGRSAAFYAETYGGPMIQPLTSASKDFFTAPPAGFTDSPLATPRGALFIYSHDQKDAAEDFLQANTQLGARVYPVTTATILEHYPMLDANRIAGGVYDTDCTTLDVHALHQGYMRANKRRGHRLLTNTRLQSAVYKQGIWTVGTSRGTCQAKVLINCAGAWASEVATMCGVRAAPINPLRRTLIKVAAPDQKAHNPDGPLLVDIEENFYFKPEGDGFLVSPADETPSTACDAQPDIEDVALAAHHFETMTGTPVNRIENKWAGLRSFATDRAPVIGFAADHTAFFWNAGQGGYGIQTSPAWSRTAAALLTGENIPQDVAALGGHADHYTPARFKETAL